MKPTANVPKIPPPYVIQNAPGGAYHTYPDGRRVFVKAKITPIPANATAYGHPMHRNDGTGAVANVPPRPAPAPITPIAPASQSAGSIATAVSADGQQIAERAGALSRYNLGTAQDAEDSTESATNYQEALRRMAASEKQDTQNHTESLNRSNLLFSGHGAQDLSNLATSYVQQRADAEGNERSHQNAIARHTLGLGSTYNQEDAQAIQGGTDRQVDRDTSAANVNGLAPNTPIETVAKAVVANKPPAAAVKKPSKPKKPAVKFTAYGHPM